MSNMDFPIQMMSEEAKALNRLADAVEKLAEVYYHCNAPQDEEGLGFEGQSLSDREHL